MTQEFVVSFGRQAIVLAAEVSAPILGAALLIGLLVSIFQAVTQIQEMTLAIIPKMFAVILMIIILFPWFLSKISTFMEYTLRDFPQMVGLL